MPFFDELRKKYELAKAESKVPTPEEFLAAREAEAPKYATGKPITPLSIIDQLTGAPTRAAVSELQKGEFNSKPLREALKAMSQDPDLAPSGEDIVKNMGVDTSTTGGKALSTGYELALDPTNLIPSKGAVAGIGALGKIADVGKLPNVIKSQRFGDILRTGLKGEEAAKDLGKVKMIDEPEKFGKIINARSAEEGGAKVVENVKPSMSVDPAQGVSALEAKVRQAFRNKYNRDISEEELAQVMSKGYGL